MGVLKPIDYRKLNARQQENYNFHKLSGLLADYGYITIRLSDDWQGADFLAHHIDGKRVLRIQLKSRLAFDKKFLGKRIYMAFPYAGEWYLFPHDKLLRQVLRLSRIKKSVSWSKHHGYSFPKPPQAILRILKRKYHVRLRNDGSA